MKQTNLIIGMVCLLAMAIQAKGVSYDIVVRTQTDSAIANENVNPWKINQLMVGGFGSDMTKKMKKSQDTIAHDFSFFDEKNNVNWGFRLTISSGKALSISGTGSGFGIDDAQFEPGESVRFELSRAYATANNSGETAVVENIQIDRMEMNGFTPDQSACLVTGGGAIRTNTTEAAFDLGPCADSALVLRALDLGGGDPQCRISCLGVHAGIHIEGLETSEKRLRRQKIPAPSDTAPEPEVQVSPKPETTIDLLIS